MRSLSHPRTAAVKIAAYGLRPRTEPIEISTSSWPTTLATLEVENLSGLAVAADGASVLQLDEAGRRSLYASFRDATAWTLGLERVLTRFHREALTQGIDFIVLKGPVLAHRFYPDPAWRPYKDLDLLVHTDEWRRACAALEGLGFRRELPEPRPAFDERFGKAAVHVDANDMRVDLHRTLVLGPFAVWLDPEALFDRTAPFELAGLTLRRLDDTMILLHACMHASLGWYPPLLQPLRDLAQVATQGDIDWDRFEADASRWRLLGVVRHSFTAVRESLDADLPAEAERIAHGPAVSKRERRALAGYTSEKRTRGGILRSTFWAVPGVRAKGALLRHLLLPDRRFLAARSASGVRPSYLRRLAIPVRWFLRRSG